MRKAGDRLKRVWGWAVTISRGYLAVVMAHFAFKHHDRMAAVLAALLIGFLGVDIRGRWLAVRAAKDKAA